MRLPPLVLGLLTALAAALAGCGSAAPAASSGSTPSAASSTPAREFTPEVQRLLAAAKAGGETELDVSWSSDVMGGTDGAKKFEALFNRMYGTNIAIRHTPGPSMTDMTSKIAQEALAGHAASTDVFVGSEGHFGPLVNKDVLQHYDYTLLSPRITP